ncbi:MAG: hypothetical protein ACI8PT_001242 [Gammaproteobacteria bacterium]
MTFEQSCEETLGGLAISACLQEFINDFAILIHGTPQVLKLASELHENPISEERIAAASVCPWQSPCVRGTKIVAPPTSMLHPDNRPDEAQKLSARSNEHLFPQK